MRDEQRYCAYMEEVLLRLSLVESITNGSFATGNELFDGEHAFLHFRKIVELIAFSSLIANKQIYALEHPKFSGHWKAKQMLATLERLNKDFYPVALCAPEQKPDGTKHFERVADGFLTQDECAFLYDKSSEIIHTRNPFDEKERVVDVLYSGADWVVRIRKLLAWHLIRLVTVAYGR